MRKTGDNEKRNRLLKTRVTLSEELIIKHGAFERGISVSSYLRAAGLRRKMQASLNDQLLLGKQLGAIETELAGLLAQSFTHPDSMLIWRKLCILSEQTERLITKFEN